MLSFYSAAASGLVAPESSFQLPLARTPAADTILEMRQVEAGATWRRLFLVDAAHTLGNRACHTATNPRNGHSVCHNAILAVRHGTIYILVDRYSCHSHRMRSAVAARHNGDIDVVWMYDSPDRSWRGYGGDKNGEYHV